MTPDPLTISPDCLLPEVKEILCKHKFRHLPVVDKEGKLVGIVTDRDIRSAFPSSVSSGDQYEESLELVNRTPVSEIMVTECTYITPDYTLDDTLMVFDRFRVGALPVLNSDGKVLGMFSIRDLTAAYKELFGLAEKGSVLIAIEDDESENTLSSLVLLLEKQKIPVTRMLRVPATEAHIGKIYLRVNTYNVTKVQRSLTEAGFALLKPQSY
jgi:acetoin utilization protein AcuB